MGRGTERERESERERERQGGTDGKNDKDRESGNASLLKRSNVTHQSQNSVMTAKVSLHTAPA
jgi:hypothetical protein